MSLRDELWWVPTPQARATPENPPIPPCPLPQIHPRGREQQARRAVGGAADARGLREPPPLSGSRRGTPIKPQKSPVEINGGGGGVWGGKGGAGAPKAPVRRIIRRQRRHRFLFFILSYLFFILFGRPMVAPAKYALPPQSR